MIRSREMPGNILGSGWGIEPPAKAFAKGAFNWNEWYERKRYLKVWSQNVQTQVRARANVLK